MSFTNLQERGNSLTGFWGSKENPLCDPIVQPSVAGAFVPTYPITRVSGTEAITSITIPYEGFQGTIILIPTAAFTWTTAGNIATSGTAVAGRSIFLTYDPNAVKWYVAAIA